jgi:transcriptional regulator with XRE-family HTH domain
MSQAECADRSGVSLGSLKRFERTRKISLESLLMLAHLLDRSQEFLQLFQINDDLEKAQLLFTKK